MDAQGRPVCLKATCPPQRLELRWSHPSNEHWVQQALHLRTESQHSAAVQRFVKALSTEGGLQELLREPGDGPHGAPGWEAQAAQGLLEPATLHCLRAVLLSMAGREDEDGERVCEALERAGATPATLHLLGREQLVAALAQPGLRPDVSDLRWWPPACVGRLIDRLTATQPERAYARAFLSVVYRGSEPAGSGNVWPEGFSGGLHKGQVALHAPQLWFLQAMYFVHTDVQAYRTSANTLLRHLENAYSVADRPRTLEDVARLTDRDLRRLGIPPSSIEDLKRPNGLLGWLQAGGRLQALQKDYKDGVAPGRAKPTSAALNVVLRPEELPQALPLREAVETARQCLQARCRGRGEAGQAGDGSIDLGTAEQRLRAYGRFWRQVEAQPLQDLLQGSQAHWQAFGRLPRPERERAQAVFERDGQQRQDVMEHLFALPMRVQALLVEATAQARGIDIYNLRQALNAVHPDRLRLLGQDTPADYRSPLHGHAGWVELAAGRDGVDGLPALGAHPQNQLRKTLRRSDEEWVPGQPTLLQQALLFHDDWRPGEGGRALDAVRAGVAHLRERVEFNVRDIKPALQLLREHGEAGPMVVEARYRPEVAANEQWQRQVGERLRQDGEPQPAVQQALRTLGQWMRHHERDMAYNPFNNRVALALRRQPSGQAFLQSVREDLFKLAQRLSQSLAKEQQFMQDGQARGKFEPLGEGIRTEEHLLQEQLQQLGSPDEPVVEVVVDVVEMAFQALYELAGPQQASGAQTPLGLSAAHDEAPASPSAAEQDFDAEAWDEIAKGNLDMNLGFDWFDDAALAARP